MQRRIPDESKTHFIDVKKVSLNSHAMIGLGSLQATSQVQTHALLKEESCASGMKPQYSEM